MEKYHSDNKQSASNTILSSPNASQAEACSMSNETLKLKPVDNLDEKKDKRKERKPEIARYQPPSTRTAKVVTETEATSTTNVSKPLTSANSSTPSPIERRVSLEKNSTKPINPSSTKPSLNEEKESQISAKSTNKEAKTATKKDDIRRGPPSAQEKTTRPNATEKTNKPSQAAESSNYHKTNNREKRTTQNEKKAPQASNTVSSNPSANKHVAREPILRDAGVALTYKNEKPLPTHSATKSIETNQKSKSSTILGGGLLKLNQNALSEMMANHEKALKLNQDNNQQCSETGHSFHANENFRQDNDDHRQSRTFTGSTDQKSQQYKRLFDPNNPNTPIYLPERSSDDMSFYKRTL